MGDTAFPSQTTEARRQYREKQREAQRLEGLSEQIRIQVKGDYERSRVRMDILLPDDEVLFRFYMSYERAHRLAGVLASKAVSR